MRLMLEFGAMQARSSGTCRDGQRGVFIPCLLYVEQDATTRGELKVAKPIPYECVYIIRPNLDEEAVDRTVAGVEEFIKTLGATIETTDKKGRRRLAYEVDKMRDGYFVLTIFHADPKQVAAVKRMLTLSEDVIRSLIVVHEKESAKTL
jgi:small subunit ribosomal protein S6